MKKLANEEWNFEILFDEGSVHTIVIENKLYFRKIVNELCNQMNGQEGNFILSRNNQIIDIGKNSEFISDLLTINPNNKKITNKILSELVKIAYQEFDQTNYITTCLEKYFDSIVQNSIYELTSESELDIQNIIKLANFKISFDYSDLIDKLIVYIKSVREFLQIDTFFLVNIRNYFEVNELELFFNTMVSEKIDLICIESNYDMCKDVEKLVEKVYIIDKDLCEIL